jgi:hypothetical protein
LAASPNPAVLGSPVTLTATVSIPAPGYGAPTDSVRFFDGTTLLGTSPVNGSVAGLALCTPRLGDRSLTAVYQGDGKLFGGISAVRTHRVVSTAKPTILSIADVPNDQGRSVRLSFGRSPYDYLGSGTPITSYYLYRKIESGSAARLAPIVGLAPAPVSQLAMAAASIPQPPAATADARIAGWDYLLTEPATTDEIYETVVPTLADSNATGIQRSIFFVRAATATPGIFYDSAPDSGYSVDNLPPPPPVRFGGESAGGSVYLHWGANQEVDLWHYRVYRGSTADFVPGPGNLVAARSDTSFVDVALPGSYYKLSAMDVNNNESSYAAAGPFVTSDVPGGGSLGGGRHAVDLAAEKRLAPGMYLVRLTQGANVRVARVVVLK